MSPSAGFDAPVQAQSAQDIDREVCEFLGIEKLPNIAVHYYLVNGEIKGCIHEYPAVSTTWEGFGLVVAALAKRKTPWGSHSFQEGQAYVKVAPGYDSGNVSSLPEALALAVLKLAQGSK